MVCGLCASILVHQFLCDYVTSNSSSSFSCIQVENVEDELQEQLKRLENGEVCVLVVAHQFDPIIHIFHGISRWTWTVFSPHK